MRGARGSRFVVVAVAAVFATSVFVPVPSADAAAPPGPVVNYCARAGVPSNITAGPDGNLWYTNLVSGSIGRMTTSGATTTFSDGVVGSNSATYTPYGITAGPDGNLWFTSALGASIGRITPTGTITRFTHVSINQPTAITAGPDGNLWFTNPPFDVGDVATISRITTAGVVTSFSDPTVDFPQSITAGPDGNLWFTEYGATPQTGAIGRITTAGVITMFTDPTIASPGGIAAGPDGNLWFTNTVNDSIGRITTAGAVTNFTHPTIDDPSQIAAGPDGNLWFTNGVATVGRITTAGVVTGFTHDSLRGRGVGVTPGPDGRMWVVHPDANSISRLSLTAAPPGPAGFRITTDAPLPCVSGLPPYSVTLAATGGTPPYKWKKISKLPKGLKLNAKTGVISGSPKKKSPGTYNVTIQVSDNKKPRPRRVVTKTFSITVDVCRPSFNPKAICKPGEA